MLDVLIVGGSVAGLSAATYLGRMRRQVVVVDAGAPCNRFSHASHGFFTRDGVDPAELLQIGRTQVQAYPTVQLRSGLVTAIVPQAEGFLVTSAVGEQWATRNVLLTMGLRDHLPALTNIEHFWGRSAFHCPYCDGWEVRDQPLAVQGNGPSAIHRAQLLLNLTDDLVICTDGPATFTEAEWQLLRARLVRVIETPLTGLTGVGEQLDTLHFADDSTLARHAIFINLRTSQPSDLVAGLGCEVDENGFVKVDAQGRTKVAGVYAAGDMTSPMRAVIFAAAQGANAGIWLNAALLANTPVK
ncbi:MAG: NAD(P)/FAD-dependent oxidoreductase [Caldilineaceae bacterium]|nr:NAD(P)/FAD-dependent oxidoreductase [Caldilineaceae bacterium]